jgi:hypothetical protein
LAAAAESCGAAPRRIPSGAGHDAMAFDKVIPFACCLSAAAAA